MIANPNAGRKRRSASQRFASVRAPVQLEVTQSTGHAEALAHQASLDGLQAVIAVGGDGTIHEVLNGLMKNKENQTALAWLPLGTANDYAASFDGLTLPKNSRFRVDVGILKFDGNCRYFANVAGVGLAGAVADRALSMRRLPARIRYTSALAMELGPQFKTRQLVLQMDDGPSTEVSALMLSAAIGKREGSYPLHPDAVLDDGLFDVLKLGQLSRIELAWYFPAMLRGNIPNSHPEIERSRCRRLEIASSSPIPIHLDGEPPPKPIYRFTLEVLPNAIDCLIL